MKKKKKRKENARNKGEKVKDGGIVASKKIEEKKKTSLKERIMCVKSESKWERTRDDRWHMCRQREKSLLDRYQETIDERL